MEPYEDEKRYQELARKWLDKSITPAEEQEFADWYNTGQDTPLNIPESFVSDEDTHHARILNKIKTAIGIEQPKRRVIPLFWRSVAAAVLIGCCIGLYLYKHQIKPQATQIAKNDIAPGANKTTLTLANGQQIVLTDAKIGKLAEQGTATVNKTEEGRIVYDADASAQNNQPLACNTLSTSIGGQTHVTLADGTQVWLNAASSLKYPTAFNGQARKVELTGEAYFEVVHNNKMPFRVVVAGQTVQDIGTHFNINAYADEPLIKTTLLEGSISVSANNYAAILKPGDQSRVPINAANPKIKVIQVDTDEETAWKSGNFQFDNADIKTVMRQLVRWYNVDVKYEGAIPQVHYSGTVPRRSNISAVLKMLKETGNTNFKIEDHTVTLLK